VRSIIFIAALLSLAPCNIVSANEIEGIRLGMTTEQTLKAAGEKGYTFSNPMKSASNSDWTSYVLMKDGPNISFCGNVLSALTKSYDSNLHEFANLVSQWTQAFGSPTETEATQRFVEGKPFSDLSYRWLGADNVRRSLGFYQLGSRSPQVSYGYSYIAHACRR
jgi:hypothetical protein